MEREKEVETFAEEQERRNETSDDIYTDILLDHVCGG